MNPAEGLRVSLQQRKPMPLAVEFTCARGEVLALVGPSGSGKSTILRCIAGLQHAAAGMVLCGKQVWFNTEEGVNLPPQKRRVGMMFQSYALFPHLSAADNIAMALGHLPSGQRMNQARRLLSQVHLDGLQRHFPATLSGGQQQRVALARALARDPAVLLLDEPFSAVDQVTRRKLKLELATLTQQLHIPIILVTHDLDEASMLANRLCIVHGGRTLQTGPPADVMKRPDNALIARLLDSQNILEGQVKEHLPEQALTLLQWQDRLLEVRFHGNFSPGERVHWLIPPGSILLHRRGRPPSKGERENPLSGRIIAILNQKGLTIVLIRVKGMADVQLTLELPPHVVTRNALEIGQDVGASLVGETIHLMPWEPTSRSRGTSNHDSFSKPSP